MVLGANDGIVSTASLDLGVAAADASTNAIVTAGVAALVAGATSMALGEYVSVASQSDSEAADIAKETRELQEMPEHELDELTAIFEDKGLSPSLARTVAVELTEKDALRTHLAEELGITEITRARPVQAAIVSGVSFTIGSAVPLLTIALAPESSRIVTTLAVAAASLTTLGYTGARVGRAGTARPMLRVLVGGLAAMGITMAIGSLVGTAIA
jgi:VIT1/CCC1 family predicted Fe2+/Mn2+ transporter